MGRGQDQASRALGRRGGSRCAHILVIEPRITVVTGERRAGPNELIGVLEVRADGSCRAAVAERVEVDGRCHIRLAPCEGCGSNTVTPQAA